MRAFAILRYLLVPFNASSLLSILYFAVALTLAEHAGLLGLILFLGTSSLFLCYGFALLEHVLDGHSQPLVLSVDVTRTFAERAIGTLLLVALFFYATGWLRQWVGPDVITLLRVLLIALFPAMLGAMSVTGRFVSALNPVTVFGTIARIPVSYAVLLVVVGVLWAVPLWMFHTTPFSLGAIWRAESLLPMGMVPVIGMRGVLIGMLGHVVVLYLWLATFACIGGALYERRRELDIQAVGAPERKAERLNAELEQERDKVMDRLYAQLRGGPFVNARESARKLVTESQNPITECRWLYARAGNFADQRLANYLAQLLLPLLLQNRAVSEALEIVRQRVAASADFRPQTSAQLLQLVELTCAAGDRATARKLLIDIDRRYGNDPLTGRLLKLQGELQR